MNPFPIILSAPSGGGKTTIARELLKYRQDVGYSVSCTTRAPRPRETHGSDYYFLTPQEFGSHFGVAKADLDKITAWLQRNGCTIDEIPAGQRAVVFSGTSGQVAAAFKTEVRRFNDGGVQHIANTTDPQVPAALADVVRGVVKLHDYKHDRSITAAAAFPNAGPSNPAFTSGSSHYLAPADYATLYDIKPLYTAGINGTGQSIAVIARSNISVSDVQSFRSMFGLVQNNPQIVITNTNPGVLYGDSTETTLDTEWAGAVAPPPLRGRLRNL